MGDILPGISEGSAPSEPLRILINQLSLAVCTAYSAFGAIVDDGSGYQNGTVSAKTQQAAIDWIQVNNPLYSNIAPVWCYEMAARTDPDSDSTHDDNQDHQHLGVLPRPECGQARTYTAGFQLFGFAATMTVPGGIGPINFLVLRGTVTSQEASIFLYGWGTNTNITLPTNTSGSGAQYGFVKSTLWSFYANSGGLFGEYNSLALSCRQAVQAVAAASNAPWCFTGHSLGGAMITLATIDNVTAGAVQRPLMVSFGSTVVGLKDFAASFQMAVPSCMRVANLCDFVPALRGLTPAVFDQPYVHVGTSMLFVWEVDDAWGNHSMQNIYIPMFQTSSMYSKIYVGTPMYPVGIALPQSGTENAGKKHHEVTEEKHHEKHH